MLATKRAEALRAQLAHEQVNVTLALGRALAVGFVVFTFLAGLTQTVLPLLSLAGGHLVRHVVEPTLLFFAREPRFGRELALLLAASGFAALLWFCRNALAWLALEAVAIALRRWAWLKAKLLGVRSMIRPQR